MAFKFSILVVANRTAQSEDLLDALRAHAERRSTRFTLLVPAQAPGPESREAAEATLNGALERMRAAGLEVDGRVGRSDPVSAVTDTWDPKEFDEVIVSTLPLHLSKWLKLDLPSKVAAASGLPVTHVVASDAHER